MLPVLYLSHGSPMLAADPGPVGKMLAALGQEMAALKPRAIVVVSPHWMTRRPAVTARAQQEAWHDFGGFPPQLYALEYAPPGAPDVAERIRALIDGNIGSTIELGTYGLGLRSNAVRHTVRAPAARMEISWLCS